MRTLLLLLPLILLCSPTEARGRKPCAGVILHPAASAGGKHRIDVGPAGMMLTRRECVWTERTDAGIREIHRWSTDDMNLRRPFHAWMFVPPGGNGFLVFCPFPGNPLFTFHDRKAKAIASWPADAMLTAEERRRARPGSRCSAEGPCGWDDVPLEQDPKLSPDGWTVELKAAGTGRRIVFFLPLGSPVGQAQDGKLLALLKLSPEAREKDLAEAAPLIADLDHAEIAVREKAARELTGRGPRSVDALHRALEDAPSAEARARAAEILSSLEPWMGVLRRPELLDALVHHPNAEVAGAARDRAARK